MKEVFHAILFGFKEVLQWHTMRWALLSGFIVSVLWLGIGYLFWDSFVALGSKIIELLPFSMLRSNGAWMLSSFLWFVLVLITFSLLFAFLANPILSRIEKEKYPRFTIMILLSSVVLWGVIWVFVGDKIYQYLIQILSQFPFQTLEEWLSALVGAYMIYTAIIATLVVFASLFSKPLLSHIFAKDVLREHAFSSIGYTIKDAIIYMVLSLLALPLLFIPVVNILVLFAMWIWLMKDTFRYDVTALLFKDKDKKKSRIHTKATLVIAGVAALFNFIPILNLLGPYIGEIAMFHYFRTKEK